MALFNTILYCISEYRDYDVSQRRCRALRFVVLEARHGFKTFGSKVADSKLQEIHEHV